MTKFVFDAIISLTNQGYHIDFIIDLVADFGFNITESQVKSVQTQMYIS